MVSDAPPKTVRTNGFRSRKERKHQNPEADQLLNSLRTFLLAEKVAKGLTWREVANKMESNFSNRGAESLFTNGGFRQLVSFAKALGVRIQVSVE